MSDDQFATNSTNVCQKAIKLIKKGHMYYAEYDMSTSMSYGGHELQI
jgi:hypothetical protein